MMVLIPVVAEAICSNHSSTDQNVCTAASCDAQQDARTAASDEWFHQKSRSSLHWDIPVRLCDSVGFTDPADDVFIIDLPIPPLITFRRSFRPAPPFALLRQSFRPAPPFALWRQSFRPAPPFALLRQSFRPASRPFLLLRFLIRFRIAVNIFLTFDLYGRPVLWESAVSSWWSWLQVSSDSGSCSNCFLISATVHATFMIFTARFSELAVGRSYVYCNRAAPAFVSESVSGLCHVSVRVA